jgi:outer membrane receptor protein involved in Fe transport
VDSLEQIQVTTAGINAEFGDASGALINYVTKSGGNEFHGGGNFFYQGKDTQANNVSEALREQGLTSAGGFEDYYDAGLLLGGPIKRNRVWFFTNFRYVNIGVRRPDFQVPIETTEKQLFTKLTLQASRGNRADVGFFFRDSLEFPFGAAASFRTSADARTWDANAKKNYILNPHWGSVITPTTLLDVRGSFAIYEILAQSPNNDGSPAFVDAVTGIISGGSAQPDGDNRRNRHEVKLDLSHFRENWLAGSHNFKTGVSWAVTPYWYTHVLKGARGDGELELVGCTRECISETPGVQHLLFNGAPFRARLYNSPARLSFELRKWAYYAQDQWVLGDRLTLNVGLRVDHATGDILESQSGGGRWDPLTIFPARPGLIDITTIAPRAGAVWDLSSDHKTALKVSAGRFYSQLNAGYLIPANPGAMGFREYDWSDRNGNRVYDAGEEGLLRADTRPNPARLPTIDPDLKNQYTEAYTVGIERQIGPNMALGITGILKRDGDLIGLVNDAVPFSAYNRITVTNPISNQPFEVFTLRSEFLGRPGQLVLTNPGDSPGDTEKLRRRYRGFEVVLRRRLVDVWQLETSYVFGDGEGNVNNHFGRSDFADYTNPNFLVNRLGDLTINPRHQFKVHGTYLAPHRVAVSAYLEALSGLPLSSSFSFLDPNLVRGAATVRVFQRDFPQIQSETFIDVAGERAGTRKFGTQARLDVRLEKKWAVRRGELATTADIFNVFNSNTVTRVNDLRFDSPQFTRAAEIQPPRQLRVALRWNF